VNDRYQIDNRLTPLSPESGREEYLGLNSLSLWESRKKYLKNRERTLALFPDIDRESVRGDNILLIETNTHHVLKFLFYGFLPASLYCLLGFLDSLQSGEKTIAMVYLSFILLNMLPLLLYHQFYKKKYKANLIAIHLNRENGMISLWSPRRGVHSSIRFSDAQGYIREIGSTHVKFGSSTPWYDLLLVEKSTGQEHSYGINFVQKGSVQELYEFIDHFLDRGRQLPDVPVLQ
jgi:hypothetical protein